MTNAVLSYSGFIVAGIALAVALTMIVLWAFGYGIVRRTQAACFHHHHRTAESWIESTLIETGMRKMFWCTGCDRHWYT